jgi:predicted RNA-binding protein with PUA-like domain
MAYWLFKEDPSHYSYAQLELEGETSWEGVRNALARQHLRGVRRGDEIFFYHSGDEKAIVALARAVGDAKVNVQDQSVTVKVKPLRRLPRPVTLAEIKADPFFAAWELTRISRLSIMPVTAAIWRRVLALSERTGAPRLFKAKRKRRPPQ